MIDRQNNVTCLRIKARNMSERSAGGVCGWLIQMLEFRGPLVRRRTDFLHINWREKHVAHVLIFSCPAVLNKNVELHASISAETNVCHLFSAVIEQNSSLLGHHECRTSPWTLCKRISCTFKKLPNHVVEVYEINPQTVNEQHIPNKPSVLCKCFAYRTAEKLDLLAQPTKRRAKGFRDPKVRKSPNHVVGVLVLGRSVVNEHFTPGERREIQEFHDLLAVATLRYVTNDELLL